VIEHKHWKRRSEEGIQGQHIAIVGYSHYRKEQDEADSAGFTQKVMKSYLSGDRKMGAMFFPPIQKYFGFDDREEFWNRVDFFNFIPECFPSAKKFASAEMKVRARAQTRFKKILSIEKPDKVFVFSRKGWNQCPDTPEETHPLKSNPQDTWGTYYLDGHTVRACGFRHPLYAPFKDMQVSVREFLKMR
jgi:hypothetical protein